jgi:hypothetical protein
MPETGLNNPKSQAPTATGIKTKTTYKIMVTDIDGMFIAEDEMTIFLTLLVSMPINPKSLRAIRRPLLTLLTY